MERWNLNKIWVQIATVCVSSLRVPIHVIAISKAKNRQKVDSFEKIQCISVSTDIDEQNLWFLNTLFITFLMVMFIRSALHTIFCFDFSYFFLLSLSSFKIPKRWWMIPGTIISIQKYWRRLKSRVPRRVPSKLCACTRAHSFPRLRKRINLPRTDMLQCYVTMLSVGMLRKFILGLAKRMHFYLGWAAQRTKKYQH